MHGSPTSIAPVAALRHARSYRADIDGLRAIAVVAVVLFHAGARALPGGFVGVDMFFVISGYLIGGIVQQEVDARTFRFVDFTARRARRILPALIAVSAATLASGFVLLGPRELARLATSEAAALVGVGNIWFWHATDYFAPDARFEPFLMTWSLGIEEQFYVLLPTLLLVLRTVPIATRLRVVAALCALSLALSIAATPIAPVESFYLLPTRAWELGIGVLLAIAQAAGWRAHPRIQRWLAAAGLAAIVAGVALLDETAAFPGYAALLPTLGTAALIASPISPINRALLSSRPLVAVGLLSYSWYLWHWPLLALLRICAATPVPGWVTLAVGVGSILPAYASWRFVERPFRRPGVTARRDLVRYAALVTLGVAALAAVVASGGIPARVGAAGAAVDRMLATGNRDGCLTGYGVAAPNRAPACMPGGTDPLVALLGDSHAGAFGDALRAAAWRRGADVVQMTAASCPALIGATVTLNEHPGAAAACARYNAAAIVHTLADPRIRTVVIAGFWQSQFSDHARAIGDRIVDLDPALADRPTARELPIALTRTLRALRRAGKRVVLLGDVPWLGFDPARHAIAAHLPLRAAIERTTTPGLDTRSGFVRRGFVDRLDDDGSRIAATSAAAVPGVRYVDVRALLCDPRRCRVGAGAMPFFTDQQHLSRVGAAYLVARIDAALWPRVTPG